MKRFFPLFPMLLFGLGLAAQQPVSSEKGVAPIPKSAITNPQSTRAVVIGISDYADDRIPDLQFAHRDAEAFAAWLQSPAGGSLPIEQIKLLANEQATAGKVIAAFSWLVEESKPGDRVIICFSGHGDVEQLTTAGWGYLLMYDSPATTYMAGGAIPVPYLQEIIATLSGREVQVVMVSDACHAGKLAGTARGGSQATANALAQKLANEIKILSCQPDEFSIEGQEWGGGRGCFSYHLVDALYGLADANKDLAVSLLEAQHYLQNIVPAETHPTGQMPFTVGNPKTQLATVIPESLTDWQKLKKQPGGLSPFAGKGMDAALLAGMDSTVQEMYKAFNAALERGDLLASATGGQSANDYYHRLIKEPGATKLHGIMTRNLAAALQDEAQVVINKVLRTDPQIVDDAFSPVGKYDHLPAYLARAAELLGRQHFMYRFLKAKEYYFRSKTYRKEKYPEWSPDSLLSLQLAMLDTSLAFDSMAAYVYLEKGQLFFWNKQQYEKASENFDKAVAFSPEWVTALYYAGRVRGPSFLNKPEEGIHLLRKAIELDSSFLPPYQVLGVEYPQTPEAKEFWVETYVARMQHHITENPDKVPLAYWNYLGNSLMLLNRLEAAETALLKGVELASDRFPLIYANLGGVYLRKGEAVKAIGPLQKVKELMPLRDQSYWALADVYILTNRFDEAESCLKQGLIVVPNNWRMTITLALAYSFHHRLQDAIQVLEQSVDAQTDPRDHHQRLGQLYELTGKPEIARVHFQKLLSMDQLRDDYFYYYQAAACCKLGMEEKFQETIRTWEKVAGESLVFIFYMSSLHAYCGNQEQSLEWLEKAFQKGFDNGGSIDSLWSTFYSPDFHLIRETEEFKALVKKYLPEQVKD